MSNYLTSDVPYSHCWQTVFMQPQPNADQSLKDVSDDKQPKWLPRRGQDKRSEAKLQLFSF